MTENPTITPIQLDSSTLALYLELAPSKVVLFQAIFESYEGVATVRTVDKEGSLVCLLTTKEMLSECLNILDSVRVELGWRAVADLAKIADANMDLISN
jgi:hypothetical protein